MSRIFPDIAQNHTPFIQDSSHLKVLQSIIGLFDVIPSPNANLNSKNKQFIGAKSSIPRTDKTYPQYKISVNEDCSQNFKESKTNDKAKSKKTIM